MRRVLFAALAAALAGQPAPRPATAVVVELYTSEGCSSCPPADLLLSRLEKESTVGGAQVIPLGFHVTYWDQLGWKDSASMVEATRRQDDYSRIFGADRVYTPQVIVDGREEMVGSDEGAVRRAIAKAALQPHAQLSVAASIDGDRAAVRGAMSAPADVKEKLTAWVFLTEDGLISVVKRGENAGFTLHNDAVVRAAVPVDPSHLAAGGAPIAFIPLRREWRRDRLRVVLVLQGERTKRVYGAAAAPLP